MKKNKMVSIMMFAAAVPVITMLGACSGQKDETSESPKVITLDPAGGGNTVTEPVAGDSSVPADSAGTTELPGTTDPSGQSGAVNTSGQEKTSGTTEKKKRANGERFEDVIILEGMEEPVKYEHIVNEALGFEMDYDYEFLERRSEADRELFVCVYDDPANPENYLEIQYVPDTADNIAASVTAELSKEYEVDKSDYFLDRAGSCTRLDASETKGGGYMPDRLQAVYVIPTKSGCLVVTAHYAIEAAEGIGRRFAYLLKTLEVSGAEVHLSKDQILTAVRNYCLKQNPDLQKTLDEGDYPTYWEVTSEDENETVVLYRSYTGALTYYHVDAVTGDTYVTVVVPGIIDEEEKNDETLNVKDYL